MGLLTPLASVSHSQQELISEFVLEERALEVWGRKEHVGPKQVSGHGTKGRRQASEPQS